MKSCDEVFELLPECLPHLTEEALEVHEHLKLCTRCAEEAEDVAHTLHALTSGADPAPALSVDFADRVLTALPAAGAPAEDGRVISLRERRGRTWLQAAAALALFAGGLATATFMGPGAASLTVGPSPPPAPQFTAVRSDRPSRVQPVAPVVPVAHLGTSYDPVQHYVAEASLVLQAVDTLDTSDPRVLALLAHHVRRSALIDHGDRLLLAIRADPANLRATRLQPLISGTQMILRKVQHAQGGDAPYAVWAIQQEVKDTGILDAYRHLVETEDHETKEKEPL